MRKTRKREGASAADCHGAIITGAMMEQGKRLLQKSPKIRWPCSLAVAPQNSRRQRGVIVQNRYFKTRLKPQNWMSSVSDTQRMGSPPGPVNDAWLRR